MPKVAILIGSESDTKFIEAAYDYFRYFGIEYELHVLSAHRNPHEVSKFAGNARNNGYSALIGAAGMAAHLAGVLAAHSDLPVIGVPMPGGISDGMDSLLSTVQMPKGVPVATFAVGKAGAINAAIFVAQFLSLTDDN
ncbi:MAG: 5-(carboxyamino)imidazole ribonucleotide mutase, partial [Calditrichaeota bacterium]|nr:5-(carboxyamino)imidazole ribonucleotide mutase [Calditrichota bacterium]